jgi:hypothetical protein
MKKLFVLLTLILAGCQASQPNQTISNHQPLQSFPVAGIESEISNVDSEEDNLELAVTAPVISPIQSRQDFVNFMQDQISELQDLRTLLDSNLGDIFSPATADNSAYLVIRTNIINSGRQRRAELESMPAFDEAVVRLQNFVVLAYHYAMEAKEAELDIYLADTASRAPLIAANAENERLANHYLSLAWGELAAQSTEPVIRKGP